MILTFIELMFIIFIIITNEIIEGNLNGRCLLALKKSLAIISMVIYGIMVIISLYFLCVWHIGCIDIIYLGLI